MLARALPADSRHGRSRRSWSAEEKRQIIAETREPGASVATVARRHDMNANLLFTWRRAAEAMSRTVRAVGSRSCPPPSPPIRCRQLRHPCGAMRGEWKSRWLAAIESSSEPMLIR
jgi:hypothetical protein